MHACFNMKKKSLYNTHIYTSIMILYAWEFSKGAHIYGYTLGGHYVNAFGSRMYNL